MANGVSETIPFRWTGERERAAVLVAEDELSDRQIAESLNIHHKTLAAWKRHPDFRAQVAHHAEDIARAMLRLTIAKKHKRVKVLDDLHSKLLTVIDERADEYANRARDETAEALARRAMRSVFGGDDEIPAGAGTGLILKQYKQIGAGRNAQLITEYAVDVRTIGEIRALHEQAAKELGQWVEKSETTHDATEAFVEALRAFGRADVVARP